MTNKKEKGLWRIVSICLLAVFLLFYLCLKFIPFGEKGEVIGDTFTKMFVKIQAIPVTWFPYPFFDSSHAALSGEKYGYGVVESISYSSDLQKGTIVVRKGFSKEVILSITKSMTVVTSINRSGYFLYRARNGRLLVDGNGQSTGFTSFKVDVGLLSVNDYVKYAYTNRNEGGASEVRENVVSEIEWIGSTNGLFY